MAPSPPTKRRAGASLTQRGKRGKWKEGRGLGPRSPRQRTLRNFFGDSTTHGPDHESAGSKETFFEDDLEEVLDLSGHASDPTRKGHLVVPLPSPPTDSPDEDGEGGQKPEAFRFYTPYYQRVFEEGLKIVLDGEGYLLNQEELTLVSRYMNLHVDAQRLFIRLFSRECKWLRLASLKYPEIDDIPLGAAELCSLDFADNDIESLSDLLAVMGIMELKEFMRDSLMVFKTTSIVTKSALIEAIIANVKSQRLITGDPIARLRKRVVQLLGPIIKIKETIVDLFERVMVIYFRSLDILERPMTAGILSEVERWSFPEYEVDRSRIFESREICIQYFDALKLHAKIERFIEKRLLSDALTHLPEIQSAWESCVKHGRLAEPSQYFLLQFTPPRVYTLLLTTFAIHILPPLHQYDLAISLLHNLLSQQFYGRGSRGKWWDQLSHLMLNHADMSPSDREETCLELCAEAVRDPLVRAGRLVSIRKRMERVAKKIWERIHLIARTNTGKGKPGKKDKVMLSGWEQIIPSDVKKRLVDLTIRDTPEVIFEGEKLPDGVTGHKSQWSTLPEPSSTSPLQVETEPRIGEIATASSVEELALQHYARRGYHGLHVENALFHHLFGLLLYPILFSPVPAVFQTRFQTYPLDLFTDDFYLGRELVIRSRCEEISGWSREELLAEIVDADARLRQKKIRAAGLAWSSFDDVVLRHIVSCMDPKAVAAVVKCMAEGYREHCGGLPDLVLWQLPSTDAGIGKVKLAEVKGPGDRLSEKQIMWMDALAAAGWEVEICKIVDTNKIRRKKLIR
ncbi:uncharacterized protein SPPG_01507 [Spizellomyces punctatus DAOM BR117]|uniref:Fanconi-associated nuclease n=2 Tax=Spizellomyces punctatus (strain DAOM BR117) TaxID=645134 RepID=A0A0L0HT61_SPIPD|nr:uncharacterized protein SPPG_01507 [Spizellomyces punctatus DAOM BR117]KND04065.1 hypothetical protein SPPG_01507 [Spizellomyces punctatus DAOM BR117]|eukprot:XP_016612104.1 hypothetical protein SPPG_01507 [Spizellomyces punctatus DAOM BR117]